MSQRDFTEREIHMSARRRAAGGGARRFQSWLEANPRDEGEEPALRGRPRAAAQHLPPAYLDERVPDGLSRLVTGEAKKLQAGAPRWRMAAAAALRLALERAAAIWPASAAWAWRHRPRMNWPKRRLPHMPSMPPSSAMQSRSAPTTRTTCSAGCRNDSA